MRKIKTFTQHEGLGSWIRSKFNSDEKTAEGILAEMDKLKETDITEETDDEDSIIEYTTTLSFNIDGFDISIIKNASVEISNGWVTTLRLTVDGESLKVSSRTLSKIYKKAESILYQEQIKRDKERQEESEYIRKDAKMRFAKK